jgi:hypothetical protein
MVVAEVLAGISLVKASVEFIKSNIDTAKDIGEIAGAVDDLFRGQDEVEKKRSKKAGLGVGDQLGIKHVAQEVIDARLAQEAMQEMRNMIDMRFGPGTWQTILDERQKRIREEKERIAALKKEEQLKRQETMEAIKVALTIAAAVATGVALIVLMAIYA